MSRTTWLLIGFSAIGAGLGFWLMGVLVHTGDRRPELVPRLQSLPAIHTLPSLAGPNLSLLDSIETPGGSVWALLADRKRPSGAATLCQFERKSAGGVSAPVCTRIEHELARVSARLAVGGNSPLLIAPQPNAEASAVAAHALTGEKQAVETAPNGSLSVQPPRGARLVRHFRLVEGGRELARISPMEGYYVGPVTGYANTRPPKVPLGATGSLATCVTPAGYVHARITPSNQTSKASSDRVEISFVSKGEVVAQVSGSLPGNRAADGTMTCGPSTAIFTYVARDGSLGELSCSPAGCERAGARLRDVEPDQLLMIARIASSTVLVWRDSHQQPLWRLGPVNTFDNSPTAPLWSSGGADSPWKLSGSLGTGQSLLLFVEGSTSHVVQVFADGSSEALASIN